MIYLAGPLSTEEERDSMDVIDSLCKSLGFKTFLPHRDVGVCEGDRKEEFYEKDIKGIDQCKLVVALLKGPVPTEGTIFEMGYAHSKKIPIICVLKDPEKHIDKMNLMLSCSSRIVSNLEELKKELIKLKSSQES